jgi:hypothetical protein
MKKIDSIVGKYITEAAKPKDQSRSISKTLAKKFGSVKDGLKKVLKKRKKKKPRVAMDKKVTKKLATRMKKFFRMLKEEYALNEASDSDPKVKALMQFLDLETDEDISKEYGEVYDTPEGEYLVLTDDGADEALRDYISDTVWAFNYDFLSFFIDDDRLAQYYGISTTYYDEELDEEIDTGDFEEAFYMHMGYSIEDWIKHLQGQYENGNDELLNLIGGNFDRFVRDAEMSDGRGHFLSGYDGVENEEKVGNEWYYIYRTN